MMRQLSKSSEGSSSDKENTKEQREMHEEEANNHMQKINNEATSHNDIVAGLPYSPEKDSSEASKLLQKTLKEYDNAINQLDEGVDREKHKRQTEDRLNKFQNGGDAYGNLVTINKDVPRDALLMAKINEMVKKVEDLINPNGKTPNNAFQHYGIGQIKCRKNNETNEYHITAPKIIPTNNLTKVSYHNVNDQLSGIPDIVFSSKKDSVPPFLTFEGRKGIVTSSVDYRYKENTYLQRLLAGKDKDITLTTSIADEGETSEQSRDWGLARSLAVVDPILPHLGDKTLHITLDSFYTNHSLPEPYDILNDNKKIKQLRKNVLATSGKGVDIGNDGDKEPTLMIRKDSDGAGQVVGYARGGQEEMFDHPVSLADLRGGKVDLIINPLIKDPDVGEQLLAGSKTNRISIVSKGDATPEFTDQNGQKVLGSRTDIGKYYDHATPEGVTEAEKETDTDADESTASNTTSEEKTETKVIEKTSSPSTNPIDTPPQKTAVEAPKETLTLEEQEVAATLDFIEKNGRLGTIILPLENGQPTKILTGLSSIFTTDGQTYRIVEITGKPSKVDRDARRNYPPSIHHVIVPTDEKGTPLSITAITTHGRSQQILRGIKSSEGYTSYLPGAGAGAGKTSLSQMVKEPDGSYSLTDQGGATIAGDAEQQLQTQKDLIDKYKHTIIKKK